LIRLFKKCGVDNEKTLFLLSDTQLFKEEVLEDISSILNQGERPNLFPMEERVEITKEMGERFPTDTEGMTNNQLMNFFIQKCKENIHLALTFSPVGEVFRKRLRTFPSLINCTTIDWFLPWPKSALESVAKSLLNAKDQETGEDNKLLDHVKINKISNIFVTMQGMVTDLSTKYFA
jgi:dynein heavy chain, axonemal